MIHERIMKQRFILFRRNGTFYCGDTDTHKQSSLRTKDEAEALTLLACEERVCPSAEPEPPTRSHLPLCLRPLGLSHMSSPSMEIA